MERNDRLFLSILQPKVPGNPAVMLVDLAVPLAPAVELAGRDAEPPDEPPGAEPWLCDMRQDRDPKAGTLDDATSQEYLEGG